MPNCSYCGRPAGLFRRYHAECRAQFDRAMGTIPLFFEKLLESDLPADRFEQLLKQVAERFHIEPKKLRSLSVQGINAMVQASLSQRLTTPDEEDRILEIAEALGLSMAELPDLEEKLTKIRVLRDLDNGRTPDRVDVVGPMPIDLESGETIIWIINGAMSYRPRKGPVQSKEPTPSKPQRDKPYLSPASLGPQPTPIGELIERGESDVMITDRRVFIISNNRHLEIPLSKVEAFHAYSDGFQIVRAGKEARPLTITVNDPWFAANLIVRLIGLQSDSGPQLEGAWKTN
jgi:hypothetical protein